MSPCQAALNIKLTVPSKNKVLNLWMIGCLLFQTSYTFPRFEFDWLIELATELCFFHSNKEP